MANKTLFFIFIFFFLFFNPALAAGLVPCGGERQEPCNTCDLINLANTIINFLIKDIIAPLAALGILAAGIVILTAGGSESRLGQGKQMLWNILIGFIIVMSAWLIVSTILAHLITGAKLPVTWNPLTNDFPACNI
ncbi:MAG: hypothetical protein AAB474_02640 [Patescibacteria group bacterium]